MNIFRYKKRAKKMLQKSVGVFDTLPYSSGSLLDLRGKIEHVKEHVPIIEIHLEEVMPFARENKKPLTIIAITLMVISSFSMFGKSHASVATFFPTSCLGGWQHPENAQGAPNLDKGAPLERFSSSNSAKLENSSAQIYCGTFSGEIPQDTLPKNFILSFNWSVDNGNIEHDKPQPFETTVGGGESSGESVLVPAVSPEGSPSENTENVSTTESDTVLSAPPVVSEPLPDSVIVTPEAPPDVVPVSDAQSFLDIFEIKKAQAEDEVPAQEVSVTEVAPTIAESPAVEPATEVTPVVENVAKSEEPVSGGEAVKDETQVIERTNISGGENTNTVSLPPVVADEAPADIFAKVTYTLDGSSWHELGDVKQSDWQHTRFELPLSTWDDMSHLQVAISSVQTLDVQPILYLDAMQVEVDYEEGKILQKPTVVIQNEDALVLDGKIDFTSDESPVFAVVNPNITASDIAVLVKEKKAEVLQDNDKVLTNEREEKKETQIEIESPAKGIVEEIKDILQIGGENKDTKSSENFGKEASSENQKSEGESDKTSAPVGVLQESDVARDVEVIEGTPPVEAQTLEVAPVTPTSEKTSELAPVGESVQTTAGLFLRLPENAFSLGSNFRRRQEEQNKNKIENVEPSFAIFSPLIARAAGIFDGVPTISEAKVLDYNGNPTTIKATIQTVTINGESRQGVSIEKPKYKFRPGRYTLEVTVETADAIIVSQQDFTWGVLAINTDKSTYIDGNIAYLQMGVLNDSGSTLCGADLDLDIFTPSGSVDHFSTSDKTIVREKKCEGNTVIDVPDYYAHYKIDSGVGRYKLVLTATTANGTKRITDGFDVGYPNFDIVRAGPTRIYPVSTYPITFTITSASDWSGTIVEKIPASFGVLPPKNGEVYEKVSSTDEVTTITWNLSLKAGQKTKFGYIFKAPEVSPEFYLLGLLSLYSEGDDIFTTNPLFQETRRWQIANDAVCGTTTGLTSGNWDGTSPVGAGSVWTGCTGAGGIPGSGDVVTINSGATITLNVNAPASGTLGAFTVDGTLTNGGGFSLTTGTASFTVNSGGTFSAGSGTITSGLLSVAGTYNANSGTISASTASTSVTMLTITSVGTFNAGSANITLAPAVSGSTLISFASGGVFTGGTSTVTLAPTGSGSSTLNAGVFTGSNKFYNLAVSPATINGVLKLGGAIEVENSLSITNGQFGTDPVVAVANCTSPVNNYSVTARDISITAGNGSAPHNFCQSTVTLTGSSGTLFARGTVAVTTTNASFDIKSDGAVTLFSGNALTFNNLTFSPVLTGNRTYTMGTAPTVNGDVTSNPTSSSTTARTLTLPTTPTFSAGKTFTVTGDTYATTELSANMSIGFLAIGTNGILSPLSNTITLTATSGPMFTISGGTFTRGTSTISITGGGSFVLNGSGFTGNNKLYNLTLNTVGTTKTLGAALELENLLTVTSGTFNTDATSNYALTSGSVSIASSINAILTLNSSTVTLNGTSGTLLTKGANGVYNGTTATVNVTSDASITFLSSSGSTVTFGNINFTPTLTGNKTYTIGSAPTVQSATLTINPTGSGNTLTVSPNATTSIGASGTLLVKGTSGATGKFDTTSSNYAFTAGFLTVDSGGFIQANASTITVSGTTGPVLSYLGGTFDADTSTVTITGAGNFVPTTSGFTGTNKFYNLTLNVSGTTKTLGADIEAEGTLNITLGTLDTDNTNNYAITAGFINIASSANTFFNARASVITLNGTSGTLFTKGANGTFTVGTSQFVLASASGTPSFLNTALTFHKVKIDSTATVINEGAALTINNVAGAELYVKNGVFNTNLALTGPGSGNGTLQIDSGGTLCLGGTVSASNTSATCNTTTTSATTRSMPTFQTYTFDPASTVIYLSNAATTISNTPTYGNLKFLPLQTAGRTYTLGGAMTINGDWDINPDGAGFQLLVNAASAGGNITVASGKTTTITRQTTATSVLDLRPSATDSTLSTGHLNIATGGTLDLTSFASTVTVGGNWTKNGTFTITSGTPTVDLTTSTTGTITGATTFYNLTKSGAGIVTLAAATTINNHLTISSGTLDDAGFQITGNASGNLTMSSGTILILGTTGTATTFPTLFTNAHCPIDAGATVTYNATVAQTISGVPNYGGLRLSTASGSPTKTLGAQVTINSTLTVDANNTLDVGSGLNYGIILAGNFTNNGTFTARAGTVSLVGTTTQTLTGNFTTASSSAFYNLSISNTSGADPSGAEVTGMTASVDFAGSATVTNNYSIAPTCTSSCTRVEYNSGSTYTFTNVTWTGAAAHKIYFRNSATSGTWLLNVSGTQSITYVDVSRSDASSGSTINATGTGNTDSGNNVNWAFTLATISGNAYNDGATTTWAECDGTNANISLVVNGGTASTTTCNASTGAYSFSSVLLGGNQPVSVHFNTTSNPSDKGVVITKTASSPSSTITGLNPHKGYVWLQEETSAAALTNTNLDHCDSGVAGCTNVPYVVTSGNLTVTATYELRITSTATFAPAGNVSASTINLAGTYTGNTETITLSGTTGTLFTRTGTFTQATTEVIVTSASGTPTLLSAATTFHRLTINSAATIINAGAAITMSSANSANRLYLQDGVLNDGGNQIAGTANGTLVMDADTSLCIGGTTSSTSATCDSGATQTTATTFPTNYTTGNITMAAGSATSGWYNASWGYRTKITIDHTKVPSTQTDFPVLISKTDTRFKTVANGGHMGNAGATDLVITSSDGTTKLNHEIEYYVATTGELLAWVKVPSLSSSTDTDLYLYYGNAGVADQQNVTGTWNSNIKQVLHVKDGTTLSVTDSTGSYNGTNSGGTATAGKIDGGVDFNLSSHISNGGTIYTMVGGSTAHTISFWVNMDDFSGGDQYVWDGDTAAGLAAFMNIAGAGIIQWGFTAGGYRSYTSTPISSTGTWYYVVAQKTSSGDNGNLYVNGTLQSTYTGTLGNPANTGSSNSQWGRYHATSLSADGKMDEMRVYNIATSADWITTEYNNQNSPSTFIPTWATEEVGTIPDATVYYLANDAMTISAAPNYRNLKFTPLITGNKTYTLGGAMTINGDWTINPNSAGANTLTVDAGGAITVASTKTTTISRQGSSAFAILDLRVSATDYDLTTGFLNIATGGTLDAGSSGSGLDITLNGISGTLFTKVGTFTEGDATVNVTSASGTPTVFSASTTVHILKINSGATVVNAGANITTDNDSGSMLWIASGVFNQENRTITAGTSGTLQIDSGGTLCLGGTTTATSATCDSGITQTTAQAMPSFTTYTFDTSSTVIYLSDAATTVSQTPTYGNLTLKPKQTSALVYTLGGAMTINGNFDINPGTAANLLTVNAGGHITVASGKTTTIQRTTSATSTLDLRPSSTDYNLTTGLLNVATGGTLDAGSSASVITLSNTSGTLFTLGGTFTITSGTPTVTLSGNGTATINSGAITFYDLTQTGTGTKSVGTAITINHNLTVSAGTFNPNTTTVTGSGTNVVSVASGATLIVDASTWAGSYSSFETRTISAGSTVDYNLAGTQTIDSTLTYANLIISGASGTKSLNGATTASETTTLSGGATTDTTAAGCGGVSCNFTTAQLSFTGGTLLGRSATITLTGTTGTPLSYSSGTFTPSTSTVTYTGNNSGGNTTVESAITYYNLILNNTSETFNPNGTITVDPAATLTVTLGTFDTTGSNYVISAGKINIANSASAIFTANASAIGITGTSGTLLTRGASGVFNGGTSIVTLSGNGTATVNSGTFTGGNKLHDLISSGTGTKTLGAAIELDGTLGVTGGTFAASSNNITTGVVSIGASGELSGGSATITNAGNWTNSGTFTKGTSTVVLSGTSTQTISGTLTGATGEFYNLTITNVSGADPSGAEVTGMTASVDFAGSATATNNYTITPTCTSSCTRVEYNNGSTYTFTNINWVGDVAHNIYFRNSATSGTWLLDVSGTQTAVSYVDVSRSDASSGSLINANDGTNTDSGVNTHWNFVSASITFDLDTYATATTSTETGAPYSVALGPLTTSSAVNSDESSINAIWFDLDASASGGVTVYVTSLNGALKSASVPSDTIPSATATMAAGTANYGLCAKRNDVTSGTFNKVSPFDGATCTTGHVNTVGAVTTSPQAIYNTGGGSITGGRAEIMVNAANSAVTPAHSDYSDTLTFIATGTF